MSDDAKDEAEEEGWRLVRYFKLHLHPAELRTSYNIATGCETSSHWNRGYSIKVDWCQRAKRSRLG